MDRFQQRKFERMLKDAERFSGGGGQGTPGAKGPRGDSGPRGPEGLRGANGLSGASGSSGAKGNQGPQGFPGPAGDQGPAGDKGPVGDPGPSGNPGPTGDPGTDGNPGSNGSDGADGAPGPIGDKGPEGDKGPTGNPGPAGAAGISGSGATLEHLFFAPGSDVEVNNGKPTGQSAAFAAIDPSWPVTAGTDFTVASDSITCNFSGTLCVEAHLFVAIDTATNGQRPAPQGRFMVNGTETGPVGASSYIRDASGHESASVYVICYVAVSAGDVITFGVRKGSTNNASVLAKSAYSQYSVRRTK